MTPQARDREAVGFRILTVSTVEDNRHAAGSPPSGLSSNGSTLEVAPSIDASEATWVSIITGRNGLGKSRTLGGATALFAFAREGRVRRRSQDKTQWRVKYLLGTHECELWNTKNGEIKASRNGVSWSPASIPLPSKVIAISTTAMDKFPLPHQKSVDDDLAEGNAYVYMGLRDRSGRASATAVVYRSLEALLEASDASLDRRARISDVFEFLGYSPRVEHTYRWRDPSIPRTGGALRELVDHSRSAYSVASRLGRLLNTAPDMFDEIQEAVSKVVRSHGPKVHLAADFRDSSPITLEQFREIQLIKRAGLILLDKVELERTNSGLRVDMREMSSGELAIATALLGVAASIDDNSLVVIDEPEVSLHPEWQSQYLALLLNLFAMYRGCHFVVATHSPLVVASVPENFANVVSLEPGDRQSVAGSEYAGDSIDEILARAFELVGDNNLFVKQKVIEALRQAADGNSNTPEFGATMDFLVGLLPRLDAASPVGDLIGQLDSVRKVDIE